MEKMTKRDYFNELKGLVEGTEREVELTEFLNHQIELLDRKGSAKTKTQIENEGLVENLFNVLSAMDKAVTITELQERDETFAAMSNQKVSALMKKLVDAKRVVKVTDKKKSYFSVEKAD